MSAFQVFYCDPNRRTGREFPVGDPHETRAGASMHVRACWRTYPEDAAKYFYREVMPCRNCGDPFPYDPDADYCPACAANPWREDARAEV